MRDLVLMSCIVFALAACAQQKDKAPAPLTAEQVDKASVDHQADINRVVDLMSSPDLAVRGSGLMQGLLYAEDRNLRQLALSMAFASNDLSLRNTALLGAIATSTSLPIRFTGYVTKNHYLSDRIGDVFTVYLSHPPDSAAEFMTRAVYGRWKTDSSGKRLELVSHGTVSGNSIKFGLDLDAAGSSECVVTLVLDPTGSALHGTLTCKNNEVYAIESSALN